MCIFRISVGLGRNLFFSRLGIQAHCLLPLFPASLCIGQNRRARGEQRPLSEAPGKNESQQECPLVPAVKGSSEQEMIGRMESIVSHAVLLLSGSTASSPASERTPLGSTQLSPGTPSSNQMPLSADRNRGWGGRSEPAGHLISTLGRGALLPTVRQPLHAI